MHITTDHYNPAAILTTAPFCDALDLGYRRDDRRNDGKYAPVTVVHYHQKSMTVQNAELLYHASDGELQPLTRLLVERCNMGGRLRAPVSGRLLRLPVARNDVLLRQGAVEELVRNKPLYAAVRDILTRESVITDMRERHGHRHTDGLEFRCDITTEAVKSSLNKIMALEKLKPRSEGFKRLIDWAYELRDDTLVREHFEEHSKRSQGRIFRIYDNRMRTDTFRVLRPGVDIDEISDVLSGEVTTVIIERETRRGTKYITKKILQYRPADDEALLQIPLGHGRQQLDMLNARTADMLLEPFFFTELQLQHLYQGATLYHALREAGRPATFPEISESQTITTKGLLPVRMVLEDVLSGAHRDLCANNFSISQRLIQAEGPNRAGKSEAWRTLSYTQMLVNAGYPVPARSCEYPIAPRAHVILCKAPSGHGGSELERNIRHMMSQLKEVGPGDIVVLDEFGDAANGPTALELAQRVLPPLLEVAGKVFVTTQHNALTQYIKEAGGLTLMPNSRARGVRRFALVPSTGKINYRAEETLDEIGLDQDAVEAALQHGMRNASRIVIEPAPMPEPRHTGWSGADDDGFDNDVPF